MEPGKGLLKGEPRWDADGFHLPKLTSYSFMLVSSSLWIPFPLTSSYTLAKMPTPRRGAKPSNNKPVARMTMARTRLPQFRQYPVYRQTFEFEGSSSIVTNVSLQNLRNLMFVVTTSSTAGVSLFDATRIVSVEMWSNQSSATTAYGDLSLEWQGTGTPGTIIKSAGTAFDPAHIKASPPKNSFASFWRAQSETGNVFTIYAPNSTVVRVTLEYTMCNGAGNAITGAALTQGTVYFNSLNSVFASTSIVAPVTLWS